MTILLSCLKCNKKEAVKNEDAQDWNCKQCLCVTCQTAQIHEFLSMHCWACFNKRFKDITDFEDTKECHDECFARNVDESGRDWCGYCVKYRGVSNQTRINKCNEKDCKHEVWE